jgi:hypothetical protein
MIAVVVGAADPYGAASGLLDKGFATPQAGEGALDHLPEVHQGDASDPVTHAAPAPRPVSTPAGARRQSSLIPKDLLPWLLLLVGATPALMILSRRSRQRRAADAVFWRGV